MSRSVLLMPAYGKSSQAPVPLTGIVLAAVSSGEVAKILQRRDVVGIVRKQS